MDSDRVLVLDAGRMVEFDEPHTLLQNESGLFSSMVKMTGKSMANNLREMARIASEMRRNKDHRFDNKKAQLRDLQGSFINTPRAGERILEDADHGSDYDSAAESGDDDAAPATEL